MFLDLFQNSSGCGKDPEGKKHQAIYRFRNRESSRLEKERDAVHQWPFQKDDEKYKQQGVQEIHHYRDGRNRLGQL